MKQTKIIIAILVAGIVVAIGITLGPAVLFGVAVSRDIRTTKARIESADHVAVLTACRDLMARRSEFRSDRQDMNLGPEQTLIDFNAQSVPQALPTVITDLQPAWLSIRDDSVQIRFHGGHYHLWMTAVPEGQVAPGDRQLTPGLSITER